MAKSGFTFCRRRGYHVLGIQSMAENQIALVENIVSSLQKAGFTSVRWIPVGELKNRLKAFPSGDAQGAPLPDTGTVVLAAFPYHRPGEPDDGSLPGDPHALIAPFARRHYYREAVIRMKAVAGNLPFPRSHFRIFSNSRLPEKPMAAAAGLGFYGRNGRTGFLLRKLQALCRLMPHRCS